MNNDIEDREDRLKILTDRLIREVFSNPIDQMDIQRIINISRVSPRDLDKKIDEIVDQNANEHFQTGE